MSQRSLVSEDWSKFNGLINKQDKVIHNVRQQSAAGWFTGALQFYNAEEVDCYSRDTGYYPSEELCAQDNVYSISIDEAFEKAKRFRF